MNIAGLIFNKLRNGFRNLPSVFEKNGVPLEHWPNILRDARQALTEVATSSEGEFLAIGEKLHHFHGRARDIGGISQSVAQSISGERTAGIITDFQTIIGRMQSLEAESNQSSQALQGILGILTTLQKQLDSFGNIVRSLRIMCVSIRIQSSQVGLEDIGFDSLADDVGKLSEEIEDRCAQLFHRSESLITTLGSAVQKARTLEMQQKARVRMVLDDTLKNLEAIAQKHRLSSEGAKVLASRYEAIGRSIGNIVMSLQIHDITRQRVEHANKALDKIADRLKEEERSLEEGKREAPLPSPGLLSRILGKWQSAPLHMSLLAQGGTVCELQIAQIGNACSELVVAVDSVLDNLREVGDLVAKIGCETRKITGGADEGDQSSLTALEAGFSSIVSALSDYNAVNLELVDVTASVRKTLQRMAGFSSEIESIGFKIKLIALNAIVKAAHFGDEGATLSVLAEAIHSLSIHTFQCTETVSRSICAIVSASDAMEGTAQEPGEKDTSISSHVGLALRELMDNLKSMNTEIVEQLSLLHSESDMLSRDIAQTIVGITIHHRVDEALQRAVSDLKAIVELAKVHCPDYCRNSHTEAFDQLESSYTMRKERTVHRSIVGAGAGATAVGAMSSISNQPEQEADILFFDDSQENESAPNTPSFAHDLDEDELLFDDPASAKKTPSPDPMDEGMDEGEEDLGDNVELF